MLLYAKNELQIALDRHSLIRSKVSLSQGLFRKIINGVITPPILSRYVQQNPYQYVSVNGLKSCMTDLLHLFDKVLIKAPIKMHSMPSNTRHTAFYLDMQFVKLRQTKSTVLSCYVLLNFALQDNCLKSIYVSYSKAYRDLITLISYSYVQQNLA